MTKKDEDTWAGKGHNRSGMVNSDALVSYLERIERIREEKREIAEDEKFVFQEAKANGFDPKIMREVLKLRAMSADDKDEWITLNDIYREAVGLTRSTDDE